MHLRLFGHQALKIGTAPTLLPLSITGSFASTPDSVAYEDRVQIVNPLGDCSVELLSGTLPTGYTLSVDNDTKEVVLTWPAYSVSTAAIENGNFESGNVSWLLSSGFSILNGSTTPDPTTPGSNWSLKYNGTGTGIVKHSALIPIGAQTSVTATCRVRQGASSGTNASAAVRVYFHGASVTFQEGSQVDSQPPDVWATSTGTFTIPAGTNYVQIAVRATRNFAAYPLWVDNFVWNVTQSSVGTNVNGSYPISIRVTDSGGRQATWSGTVTVT